MKTNNLPYGTIRVLIAKAVIKERDGLLYWYLGRQYIGSWKGTPPRGAVYVRNGILDLFTGEYSIVKPQTNMFNN